MTYEYHHHRHHHHRHHHHSYHHGGQGGYGALKADQARATHPPAKADTHPPASAPEVHSVLGRDPQQNIATVAQLAQQAHPDNPVLARLALAQAVIESNLEGAVSGLAKAYKNLFGVKGGGNAGTVELHTHEVVNGASKPTVAHFAKNTSMEASFQQHKAVLQKHFPAVLEAHDFHDAATRLKGYASDPHYAERLMKIDQKYGHLIADVSGGARQKTSAHETAPYHANGGAQQRKMAGAVGNGHTV